MPAAPHAAPRLTEGTVLTPPKLLVFDLDGTLVDSQVDLTNSVNAMLGHFGHGPLDVSTIATYIGDGAPALVQRALVQAHVLAQRPEAPDNILLKSALDWFVDYYRQHKLDFTYVYPGVLESMSEIRNRHPDLPMAILTNKPVIPSRAICSHFGFDRFCFQVYGGNSFPTKKPDPSAFFQLIAEAQELCGKPILPRESWMIGDSHVDVQTARAAGACSLGCTFGLSPASLAAASPDKCVDHASDWPAALGL